MLKKLLFVGMILMLMVSFTAVLADQDGNTCWCNVDKDGCWGTNAEGEKNYIMFWTEEARRFYMGDSTAPYANVVDRAEGATLGLFCGAPKVTFKKTIESICKQWVDEQWEIVKSWGYNSKDEAVKACSGSYESVEAAEEAYISSQTQQDNNKPIDDKPVVD